MYTANLVYSLQHVNYTATGLRVLVFTTCSYRTSCTQLARSCLQSVVNGMYFDTGNAQLLSNGMHD